MKFSLPEEYEKIVGFMPDNTTSYIISDRLYEDYPIKRRLGIIYAEEKDRSLTAISVDMQGKPYFFSDSDNNLFPNHDIVTVGEPINFADIDCFWKNYKDKDAEDILWIIATLKKLGLTFIMPEDEPYEIYIDLKKDETDFYIWTNDDYINLLPFGTTGMFSEFPDERFCVNDPNSFTKLGRALGLLRCAFSPLNFRFKLNFKWYTEFMGEEVCKEIFEENNIKTTYEEQCEFEKEAQEKYGESWANKIYVESDKFLKENGIIR